ncbi:hypothetical protein ABZ614_41630 [Streptomyces sp. NPDC013178]|uniref:hypothetical protein n=1 Tax=Streptomyces sp. NPDC013178 TaxID=3155118 RepID=UPI0033EBE6E2
MPTNRDYMPNYGDYDAAVIQINPELLNADGQKMLALGKEIANSVVRIAKTLKDLQLNWVATSQEEADAFNDQWNSVMLSMFGNEETKELGALPAMAAGVIAGAVGFSNGENLLWSIWNQFHTDISIPPVGPQPGPADRVGPEYPIEQDYPNA